MELTKALTYTVGRSSTSWQQEINQNTRGIFHYDGTRVPLEYSDDRNIIGNSTIKV